MPWKKTSNFLELEEGQKIHYIANFDPRDLNEECKDLVIVFNYGLVCNFEHFKYQVDFFHEKGFKVLLHDYRCHFKSSCFDGVHTCTFKNICNDLKALLEHLKVSRTLMVGHSMGVNVTLEFARLYPENIQGMILISGTVFPPQDVMFDSNIVDIAEPHIHNLKDTLGDIFDMIWKSQHKNPLARLIVWQGGFNIRKTKLEFVEFYMKKIGELPSELFFHLMNEMKKHNIINDLEKIDTPALIIGGDKDKIIPNYLQRILKKYLKNSKLYIVKDGSHVPQIDFPVSINERSLNFAKKL